MSIWWAIALICLVYSFQESKIKELESKIDDLDPSRRINYIPDYWEDDDDDDD
jgi:hypothetical protein